MPHYSYKLIDAVDCLFYYALGDVKAALAITQFEDQFVSMIDPFLMIDCSIAFTKMNAQDKPTI